MTVVRRASCDRLTIRSRSETKEVRSSNKGVLTCHVVDVVLDDQPVAVGIIPVLGHFGGRVCLRHGGGCVGGCVQREMSNSKDIKLDLKTQDGKQV
jgi:hypothetical protein